MLRQTFCHLPGIGAATERRLWSQGLHTWDDVDGADLPAARRAKLQRGLADSLEHARRGNAAFFGRALPSREQWRLFADFRSHAAYLDIETTGLGGPGDHVTTIALYDGQRVRHYVHGQNIEQFPRDIQHYRLLVTYNGKCFDVPVLEQTFGIRLDHAHIDLRYVLHSLGYSGGLKGCEKQLGLDRGDTDGIDGYLAVLLWREYRRTGDPAALETLIAYNVQDVLTLETLLTFAYNAKLRDTPFAGALALPEAPLRTNPFRADRALVDRLVSRFVARPW